MLRKLSFFPPDPAEKTTSIHEINVDKQQDFVIQFHWMYMGVIMP